MADTALVADVPKLTKAQTDELEKIVFAAVGDALDAHPADGKTAMGTFSERVWYGQEKFRDGIRFARLTACAAIGRLAISARTQEGETP
jgi:hypothetical protein